MVPPVIVPPLPPIQDIHGWSEQQVHDLQLETAKALKMDVDHSDPLKDGSQGPLMVLIPAGRFYTPRGQNIGFQLP